MSHSSKCNSLGKEHLCEYASRPNLPHFLPHLHAFAGRFPSGSLWMYSRIFASISAVRSGNISINSLAACATLMPISTRNTEAEEEEEDEDDEDEEALS